MPLSMKTKMTEKNLYLIVLKMKRITLKFRSAIREDGFNLDEAIRQDQNSEIESVRKRGLLAAVKLRWKLSAQGGTVTAKFEYVRKKENELCR